MNIEMLCSTMATYTTERVLRLHHWSDAVFSFSTTRNPGLRFENGQFVMLSLQGDGATRITRAYSIASANYEDQLEFYSIKVPNGPLTSRLQFIEPGSPLLVSTKPTGTLVLRDLKPGKRLFMLATGTGVAPFLAIVKDPETYERFEQVFLIRGARTVDGLAYADSVLQGLRHEPYLGELANAQLRDYPTVTRQMFRNRGRITTLIGSGALFANLAIPPLDPENDRLMVCGNMRMIADLSRLLDSKGFKVSPRVGVAGDYAIERAFVETYDAAPVGDEDGAHRDVAVGSA
jgi:ferredoxin--NADP+ reductase